MSEIFILDDPLYTVLLLATHKLVGDLWELAVSESVRRLVEDHRRRPGVRQVPAAWVKSHFV